VFTHVDSGYSVNFDGSGGNLGNASASDVPFGWGESPGLFIVDKTFGAISKQQLPDPPVDLPGLSSVTIFDELDDSGQDGILSGSITMVETPSPSTLGLVGAAALVVSGRRLRQALSQEWFQSADLCTSVATQICGKQDGEGEKPTHLEEITNLSIERGRPNG